MGKSIGRISPSPCLREDAAARGMGAAGVVNTYEGLFFAGQIVLINGTV